MAKTVTTAIGVTKNATMMRSCSRMSGAAIRTVARIITANTTGPNTANWLPRNSSARSRLGRTSSPSTRPPVCLNVTRPLARFQATLGATTSAASASASHSAGVVHSVRARWLTSAASRRPATK